MTQSFRPINHEDHTSLVVAHRAPPTNLPSWTKIWRNNIWRRPSPQHGIANESRTAIFLSGMVHPHHVPAEVFGPHLWTSTASGGTCADTDGGVQLLSPEHARMLQRHAEWDGQAMQISEAFAPWVVCLLDRCHQPNNGSSIAPIHIPDGAQDILLAFGHCEAASHLSRLRTTRI